MVRYFVSYSHSGRYGSGFGQSEMVLNEPITGLETVRAIAKVIARDDDPGNVVILNWRRFEESE